MDLSKEELDEILFSGKIYDPMDDAIVPGQLEKIAIVNKYNKTKNNKAGLKKRDKLIHKMFRSAGDNCYIEPPAHANFGFSHVVLGNGVYANFNFTCVDDGLIEIGDNTLIGPNVTLVTASHPASPILRKDGYQYNKSVKIGKRVWLGANVTVLPGVTIGDNSIIGAGSVVTKDIPSDVIAFGVPAKVYRKITIEDEKYYDHDKNISEEIIKKIGGF